MNSMQQLGAQKAQIVPRALQTPAYRGAPPGSTPVYHLLDKILSPKRPYSAISLVYFCHLSFRRYPVVASKCF